MKPKPLKIAVGGRGSGKTICFSDCFLKFCDGGEKVICAREFQNSIEESVHSSMIRRIQEHDIPTLHPLAKNITSDNGGKIVYAEKGYSIGGHVPFGYTKEYDNSGSRRRTKLVPVPEEQEVLKFIKAAREQGLGARRIATQIQNRFPGFEDFPYHKVHRIIKRKFQGLHE